MGNGIGINENEEELMRLYYVWNGILILVRRYVSWRLEYRALREGEFAIDCVLGNSVYKSDL